MYESFFKLQRRPFSATPDPSCVYQVGEIQTVIDELVINLERGEGIAVLTAPAGLGKTLLCEKIKQELGTSLVTILLRHADFRSPADLLRTLLMELGDKSTAGAEPELRRRLKCALTDLREENRLLAVICDEAHLLGDEALEELRRLVDYADHGVSWVRILLAGQLELEEKLASPQLSAVNQRLRSHASLSPFTTQESLDYIDYRITWAGGRVEEVFQPETVMAIVDAADGNPRCLNQLCDHVLLLAYVAEQMPVSIELVPEALADLQHLPLTWHVRSQRSFETQPKRVTSQASESTVEFGEHLAEWELTPTFADPMSSEAEGVWEFGSTTPEEIPAASISKDPFENLLAAVESELDRMESLEASAQICEEPVLDRYAAIDAGWPVEQLPPPDVVLSEPVANRAPIAPPAKAPVSDVETRIHGEVLELVTTTREITASRRFDDAVSSAGVSWESERTPSVEETQPPTSATRPFRNLFTRLRRKQKGLE